MKKPKTSAPREAIARTSKASDSSSLWRSVSGRLVDVRNRAKSDPYLKWFLRNRLRLAKANQITMLRNPGGARTEPVSKLGPFSFVRCKASGFIFVNPRLKPRATVEYFCSPELAGYFDIVERSISFRQENSYVPVARFLRGQLPAGSCLIEVGCGGGGFLEILRDVAKFNVEGIEIANGAVPHWRKRNLRVHKTLLEEFQAKGNADIVLMWSVMDHFYDPIAALKKCNAMLKPGGHIFIGNINTDGFDHQILGFDSATFSPPGRVNYYNIKSLARHLALGGFEVVDTETPGVLDVDMARDYWSSGGRNGRHPFFENLIMNEENAAAAAAFQDFLRANKLSGYQRVLARKVKEAH